MGEVRVTGLKRQVFDLLESDPDRWFTVERIKDELAFKGFRVGATSSIAGTCGNLVRQFPKFFERQEGARGIYRYHEVDEPKPVMTTIQAVEQALYESAHTPPKTFGDEDILFISTDETVMLVKFDKRIWKCVVVMEI